MEEKATASQRSATENVRRRQLERSVALTGGERLRSLWYRLRLTIAEMNYATTRLAELQRRLPDGIRDAPRDRRLPSASGASSDAVKIYRRPSVTWGLPARILVCMRFVPLSDHAGEMLRQARRSRAGAGKRDEERYRLSLAAYDRSVSEARERRDRAAARWRLLSALRWGMAVRRRQRSGPPARPADRGPSRNEAALEAGAEGEREVHAALDRALDDSWALFKGYRNRAGEIDYLLIGPTGLFAIEVKHVNGAFRITPGQWLYRRSDGYGNEVGDVTVLADRGGRPPQVQLAEPLEQLERFIAKRGQPIPWRPAVLLTHPRAKIISCADGLRAPVLTSTEQLLNLVGSADGEIGSGQLGEIGRLIERDHRYQAERRRSGTQ